jgi:uncharacterized membrane protein YhiD involved in acid resistance
MGGTAKYLRMIDSYRSGLVEPVCRWYCPMCVPSCRRQTKALKVGPMTMPLYPSWSDIAARLLLTMIAGAIIGTNRGIRGQAAGLRTTILVALAASVAMVQANVLLSLEGKTNTSFAVMDLMRLPLGILTGVGFIGGGVILRRGDLVTGVTTAATLWATTVIGSASGVARSSWA